MKTKRTKTKLFFAILIALCSLLVLSGCFASEIKSAKINEHGDFIITYENGTEKNVGNIHSQGDTTINVSSSGESISSATAKGLMSAVSIRANFTGFTGGYGGIIPGLGGSLKDYYSQGSGVIYKLDKDAASAFIITNHHVVYDSSSTSQDGISEDILVYLYGAENEKQAISAEYVGGSMYYDIAVLYVKEASALRGEAVSAVTISNDTVAVGDSAIAIGNPEGAGISATLGIVSVDSEYITMPAASGTTNVTSRVIRVDTAVNSGNSGGGLYNSKGELVGIVNAKIIDESVENIGYAIPTAVAIAAADNIIDNCFGKDGDTVSRALLGITLSTVSSSAKVESETGRLKIIETVAVDTVEGDSAAFGKLKSGDVLRSVTLKDRTVEITRNHSIIDLMLHVRQGDTVSIELERDGESVTVDITLNASNFIEY